MMRYGEKRALEIGAQQEQEIDAIIARYTVTNRLEMEIRETGLSEEQIEEFKDTIEPCHLADTSDVFEERIHEAYNLFMEMEEANEAREEDASIHSA